MLRKLQKNNKALNPDLFWAITSYYNPFHSKSRILNYHNFINNLKIPIITVEWSYNNTFELKEEDADILIQISGGSILWQKERLLNIAIDSLPAHCTLVAWVDCDIIFEDEDWTDKAKEMLKKNHVIQLFEDVIYLNRYKTKKLNSRLASKLPNNKILKSSASENKKGKYLIDTEMNSSIPGLAFASQKKWIQELGFYDAAVIGGGDSLMFHGIIGLTELFFAKRSFSSAHIKHFKKWLKKIPLNTRISYLPGAIYHQYHGNLKNRKYFEREHILSNLNFDPEKHLFLTSDGVWGFSKNTSKLEKTIFEYFQSRNEN